MKFFIFTLALFSFGVTAQTVINYEDGSSYTLKNGESIFVSYDDNLWVRQLYAKGDVYFRKQIPWPKRDHVPDPNEGVVQSDHEWCLSYAPWSEGYTFEMVRWQQVCDSNNDGVYDENDTVWED